MFYNITEYKNTLSSHAYDFPYSKTVSRSKKFSYNKSQRDALFLKFILINKELYMFRTDLLSIIRSLNTVYTVIGIYHATSVDSLRRQST